MANKVIVAEKKLKWAKTQGTTADVKKARHELGEALNCKEK